ncbi:hypothetical protein CSKR_110589 [Clonorchis sinensis]|uniref:Uncharacterized protein n=1 Tax=Clonorchis sinensis TaxID=79923 RepID=A0A8T1MU64_CLOSI|nr:hypothetical protein CSKR_110589 [Clonorchis sinensis]
MKKSHLIIFSLVVQFVNLLRNELATNWDKRFGQCSTGCVGRCTNSTLSLLCSYRCGRDALDGCTSECISDMPCILSNLNMQRKIWKI